MPTATSAAPIGGSEAAAACGLDPWRSRVRLWAEKTGRLAPSDDTEAAFWGRALEVVVAEEVAARYEAEVVDGPRELRDERYPWMVGHPDRYITRAGELGILEVKTAGMRQEHAWADGATPLGYVLQAHHYLALTDLPFALVAVLLGGQRLELRRLDRDDSLAELLRATERQFWHYVETDAVPPPSSASGDDRAAFDLYPSSRREARKSLSTAAQRCLGELRELTTARDAIDRAIARRREVVQVELGDAELGTVAGEPVVKWAAGEQRRIDTTRLRAEAPELAAQYETVTTYRRFTLL